MAPRLAWTIAMGVFISHRHAEASVWAATYLADHLKKKYGAAEVFIDVDSIRGGQDWRKRLLEGVDHTQAVLVLIDSQWTTVTEADGTRRLDNPGYWVRKEIEAAFAIADVQVIPVLLGDAKKPTASELPGSIARLHVLQEVRLRHSSWDSDVDQLVARIDALMWAEPAAARRLAETLNDARRRANRSQLDRAAVRRGAKAFELPPGVDPRDVADNLATFFEEKGMQSQVRRHEAGHRVNGAQRGGLRALAGMESAIEVLVMPDGDHLLVHVKAGSSRDKVAAVALAPFTGLVTLGTAMYGTARHVNLPEQTYRRVENYLLDRRGRR